MKLSLLSLFLFATTVNCFTIPGVSTQIYSHGESVPLYVNELDSVINQVPYDYYFLRFCQPHKKITDNFENLGSLLLGQKTLTSPYSFFQKIYIGIDLQCQYVCERHLTDLDVNDFRWFIQHGYRINMEIDSLPGIQNISKPDDSYELKPGYPIGYIDPDNGEYYINNHVTFEIEIFPLHKDDYRIVGFKSVGKMKNQTLRYENSCADAEDFLDDDQYPLPQSLNSSHPLVFSYDIRFTVNPNKTYGSRWDQYVNGISNQVQWVSLSFTFLIAFFLTGIVALLIRFALRRDLIRYKHSTDLPQSGDLQDMGWKQLSRDVFRPPTHPMTLSVLLGTGIQIVSLIACSVFLACLGFVYQAHRGNAVTMIIVVFVFTGSLNGYHTARFYKYFKGSFWLLCTLVANLAFPAIILLVQWIIHMTLVLEESSSKITFKTAITFIALWFGIQVPLNLVGAFIGYKMDTPKNPCKHYPIAQYIPPQPWYMEDFYVCVIGGLICFSSVGIEFSFIMQLMWTHSFFQFFASLFLSLFLLCVISGEMAIIVTYFSLLKGNHRWWWKAFMVPFTAGGYLFTYSLQYYLAELTFTRLSAIVYYFGTMFLVSLVFGLICGTVGFLAAYMFVHKIYSLIRND